MLELHQKLGMRGLFQKLEIVNRKEIFDRLYKIYRDKTLIDVHIKKQLQLDKKLKPKN